MQIKRNKNQKRLVLALVFISIIIALVIAAFFVSGKGIAPQGHKVTKRKVVTKSAPAQAVFDKSKYSTTDPNSIWVVVNKSHPLNLKDYQPSDLAGVGGQQVSAKMAPSLQKLIADAKSQGVNLHVISGYRSYSYQTNLYNSYVASDGQAKADTYSARPGYSEHQTGFAADLGGAHGCDVDPCFSNTPEGKWLADNANTYGFLVRYTPADQSITGYEAEAWHIRYVGVDLTSEMKKENITTLEQFFGINGGTAYVN